MNLANARLGGLVLMMIAGTPSDAAEGNAGGARLLADFTSNGDDLGWYVVNDDVMGGRSVGGFNIADGDLRFSGRTDTDGGGFSSIRTAPVRLDLSAFEGIRLRVRADGRRYTWRLATDARYRGRPIAYWAEFDTRAGEGQTIDVPFARFEPRYRGTSLDGPSLDTRSITGMGLMIYDERDGPFELALEAVYAYGEPAFSLLRYRWEKRVLIVSAPAAKDEMYDKQMSAIDAARSAFEDRDMLLVTLLDDGPATAGERALSVEDVAGARAALAVRPDTFALRLIGKDGGVKLASEAPVPMDEIYALIDRMPMRQREKK